MDTARVRATREQLSRQGPSWTRAGENDFNRVTLPEHDGDLLRDRGAAADGRDCADGHDAG
jgi:hypothetical protein